MHPTLLTIFVNLAPKNGKSYKNNSTFYLFLMYTAQHWSVDLIIIIKRYLSSSVKILAHKTHFVAADVITN